MEKAELSVDAVTDLVKRLYGLTVVKQTTLTSYDDVNIRVLTTGIPENTHIKQRSSDGYVLKVLNSVDSKKEKFVGAMHSAISCVRKVGVITPYPVQTVDGQWYSVEHLPSSSNRHGSSSRFLVRLFHFIPGETLQGTPYTAELCWQVGRLAGQLDLALKDFSHPGLVNHKRHWNLSEIVKLGSYSKYIADNTDRQLVVEVAEAFTNRVMNNAQSLQKGVIHGDLNEGNILIRSGPCTTEEDEEEIHGILDFGDMAHEYHVFEVAIAMMYMMIESTLIDEIDAGGHVLAGYLSTFSLPSADLGVLKECICGRFAQSLAYGAAELINNPENTHCQNTSRRGWAVLRRLWATPTVDIFSRWQDILSSRGVDVSLI